MAIVESLFDVSWDELQKVDVDRFLEGAEDEGLTWEVKGDERTSRWPRREQVEKAVGGFANSRLGGVLIVGAERTDKRKPGWTLTGLNPPSESEVPLSLARTIRSGVRPSPPLDIKVFPTEDGKVAAVVWVRPVDRPPAITRDGRVFVRTVGATEPVTDPATLERLFGAGLEAVRTAEAKAVDVAQRSLRAAGAVPHQSQFDWGDTNSRRGRLAVGVAATTHGADIGGRLFRLDFRTAFEELVHNHLVCIRGVGLPEGDQLVIRQRRDAVLGRLDPTFGQDYARRFGIRADWNGGVGIAILEAEGSRLNLSFREVLVPAWMAAARLVSLLGGEGGLHLAIVGEGPIDPGARWRQSEAPISRWFETVEDSDGTISVVQEDLDYVENELARLAGEERWIDG